MLLESPSGALIDPTLSTSMAWTAANEPGAMRSMIGAGAEDFSPVGAPASCLTKRNVLVQFTCDLHLARIRELLLRTAGFEVTTLCAEKGLDFPGLQDAAAALFCQTLTDGEANRLLARLHSFAAPVKTIRLSRQPVDETGQYDCVLQAPVPPALLVEEATRCAVPFARKRMG